MGFSRILGQPRAEHLLRRLWMSGRNPPFLLFLGPSGVGRGWAARQYAQVLLCDHPVPEEGACLECSGCLKVDRGSHPDFLIVDLKFQESIDKESSSSALKIATVREALRRFQYRPFEGPRSVCLIDQAQDLTTEAQVAMLKILEESPAHLTWIWVVGSEEHLLPTILSRVNVKVYFQLLDTEPLAGIISRVMGVEESAARVLAQMSGGSIIRARRILERQGVPSSVSVEPKILNPNEIYALSSRVARFRAASVARNQTRQVIEDIEVDALGAWRQNPSAAALKRLQLVLDAERDLEANVTPALVLERLLLKMGR